MVDRMDYQSYFAKGISFDSYLSKLTDEIATGGGGDHAEYLPQNYQRIKRILRTTHLQESILQVIKALEHPVKWLVISEGWCGDAAQIVPVLQLLAEASNGRIELRIVYRDENEALMAAHLTNGSKSIPKLIQLDPDFKFIAEWGPRPAAAQRLVMELKSSPDTAANYADKLHKWYADNKTLEIQNELINVLEKSVVSDPVK